MNLIAELKRRKVIRAGVLYVGATWAFGQGLSQFSPALGLPAWLTRWFLIAAAIGFPIVLVLSWMFDVRLHGIRREAESVQSMPAATASPSATVAATAETPPAIPHKSIAVLPFTDLSPTHDQEYFSDGIAEEILNALVKVRDLKVAGRTSSFSFKGRNEDMRSIGKTLAVAHVLEGSVRKHGDKVRITAQLVRTDSGYHLWSENFDGDLSDVFELQERIARAITRELDVILSGDQQQRLVPVATQNPEAYALYLQATAIFNRRDGARFPEAVEMLRKAVALDSGFARAYARLAAIHALEPMYTNCADTAVAAVRHAAAQASALDPALGEPYAAVAMACLYERRFIEGREAIEHALQLQPDDLTALYWAGMLAVMTGYTALGCAQLDRVLVIDPLCSIALLWRGTQYAMAGDLIRAESMLQKAADTGLVHASLGMHAVKAARGHTVEATAQLTRGLAVMFQEGLSKGAQAVLAQAVYGDAAARAQALALIERCVAPQPRLLPGAIPYILLLIGEAPRALELVLRFRSTNEAAYLRCLWTPPSLQSMRKSSQFRTFTCEMGLTTLWDRYGAPDGAYRNAAGEYVWE